MPFLASEGCFWPLTASMTSEVKKNHAHVYPNRKLSKFSEINFSIECMVTIGLGDALESFDISNVSIGD